MKKQPGHSVPELAEEYETWRKIVRQVEHCPECGLPVQYPTLRAGVAYHAWCAENLTLRSTKSSPVLPERTLPDWKQVAICAKCGQAAPDSVFFHGQPHHRRCAY